MTELAYMPKTLIALACSLAKFNVFLSSELPFYVRDENYTWKGYCKLGRYDVILTAGTLVELEGKMFAWYNELEDEYEKEIK